MNAIRFVMSFLAAVFPRLGRSVCYFMLFVHCIIISCLAGDAKPLNEVNRKCVYVNLYEEDVAECSQ